MLDVQTYWILSDSYVCVFFTPDMKKCKICITASKHIPCMSKHKKHIIMLQFVEKEMFILNKSIVDRLYLRQNINFKAYLYK